MFPESRDSELEEQVLYESDGITYYRNNPLGAQPHLPLQPLPPDDDDNCCAIS
jgi:hypothetical protein